MKNKFTYTIIRFLEKILPTRLLDPTRLSYLKKIPTYTALLLELQDY